MKWQCGLGTSDLG